MPAKANARAGTVTRRQADLEALSVLQNIKPSAPHLVSFSKPVGFCENVPLFAFLSIKTRQKQKGFRFFENFFDFLNFFGTFYFPVPDE